MNVKEYIRKITIKFLWFIVYVLFFLSLYKIYLFESYKSYVSEYNKTSNFYYPLKELQKDTKEIAKNENFKINEYYFMPAEKKFIAVVEEGSYKGEKIYGIILEFYIVDNEFYQYYTTNTNYEKYMFNFITNKDELSNLKKGQLVYKFNDEQLEKLYKKIEEKSEAILWF